MNKEYIDALLGLSQLIRPEAHTLQAALTGLSAQSNGTLQLTPEMMLHMHIEAQTYLLAQILAKLESLEDNSEMERMRREQ